MNGFQSISRWLLFTVVPCILAGSAASLAFQIHRENLCRQAQNTLKTGLQEIISESSEDAFLTDWFAKTKNGALPKGLQPPWFHILSSGTTGIRYIELVHLREFLASGKRPSEETQARWQDSFGWKFDPIQFARCPGIPIEVRWENRPAWLVWGVDVPDPATPASPGIRLGICRSPELLERIATVLRRFKRRGDMVGGVFDPERRRSWSHPDLGPDWVRRFQTSAGGAPSLILQMDSKVAVFRLFKGNVAVCLEKGLPRYVHPSFLSWIHGFSAFLLIFCTALHFIASRNVNWSLRLRLFAFIFYLLMVPLLSVGIFAMNVLSGKKRILMDEWERETGNALMAFDEQFRLEERFAKKRLEKLSRLPDLRYGRWNRLCRLLNRLKKRGHLFFVTACGWDGRFLFSSQSEGKDPGAENLQELVAKKVLAKHLGRPVETFLSPQDRLAYDLVFDPEFGLFFQESIPGRTVQYRIGSQFYYNYSFFGDQSRNEVGGYFLISCPHLNWEELYVNKRLIQPRKDFFLARSRSNRVWYPWRKVAMGFDILCGAIASTGEQQTRKMILRGERYVATGIPGKNLAGFDLVACAPETRILEGMKSFERMLLWGVFLALMTGGVGVWSLSRGLLMPIRAIEGGIQALKRRDRSFRIHETGKDELGLLAQTFNHILETAGELDAASLLQEALIPAQLPSWPGYSLEMRFLRSQAIGGDYVDVVKTNSGSLVFLVGDVAGHGVGSALIMAMAKALVFLHFSENGTVQDLLPKLNMALCKVSRKRAMMTFSLGILDPVTHDGRVFPGGNPYPLLWKGSSGEGEFLGYPRYPLGIKDNQSFGEGIPFHLDPGDLLFLYTDGLVEIPDSDNRPFGYSLLVETMRNQGLWGSASLCEVIQKGVLQHAGGRALPDDISFLAIKREKTRGDSL